MTEQSTYERVSEWNLRCNNKPSETGTEKYWTALKNQAERVQEELNELNKAIKSKDTLDLFDAILDLDIVVSGAAYLSNGDYVGGVESVLSNNDRKYTTSRRAIEVVEAHYLGCGEEVSIHEARDSDNRDIYYSVHRVVDNKIMKFPGHPPVDLIPFAPEGGG